jgi:hypothetical protein
MSGRKNLIQPSIPHGFLGRELLGPSAKGEGPAPAFESSPIPHLFHYGVKQATAKFTFVYTRRPAQSKHLFSDSLDYSNCSASAPAVTADFFGTYPLLTPVSVRPYYTDLPVSCPAPSTTKSKASGAYSIASFCAQSEKISAGGAADYSAGASASFSSLLVTPSVTTVIEECSVVRRWDQWTTMLAHWHTRTALMVLFALTWASAAEDASRPSGLPTHRSTVSEVRVTYFATDENNHPVATLTKSDFAIVDNELVVRNFRSFTHADETSLDVVAPVDLSQSVAPRFRVAMSDVLQLVAREQSIPDDNIAVLSFGGTLGGTFGAMVEEHLEGRLVAYVLPSSAPAVAVPPTPSADSSR